jgi:hypothetical protein
MAPPVAWLAMLILLKTVLPALLKVVPAATFRPPLKVARPVVVRLPPRLVAPVPTVKVLVPVTLVLPFKETVPVPLLKVPLVWV